MGRPHVDRIIEKVLMNSMQGFIQALPASERRIFSLYLAGQTPEQIVTLSGSEFSLEAVASVIEQIKKRLLAAYSLFPTPQEQ